MALVAAPAPGSVVFFVGGDPNLREQLESYPVPIGGVVRAFFPVSWVFSRAPPQTAEEPDPPWLVPVDQLRCIELLERAVRKTGQQVRVVDVNRPGEDRELVRRWVGTDDVLPVLVRSDGARLVGEEAFSPAALRRFLSAP